MKRATEAVNLREMFHNGQPVNISTGPSIQQVEEMRKILQQIDEQSKGPRFTLAELKQLADGQIMARKLAEFDWDRAADLDYLQWFFKKHELDAA